MDEIHQHIEEIRREMMRLVGEYGFSDSRVLTKSQELDRVLNTYQREKCKLKEHRYPGVIHLSLSSVTASAEFIN
ncbi:Spo0E family sporulation regulatory protein-aspartic acid phosphatase [Paenibacillus chitinolyticus]|uniref:Spo0E family sporulation regulatory protein-aspartic acid phosphatase n=1 Tax=Paenibacillus chitinolyticus TaxID=79263 RepID=UPI00364CFE01